MGVYRVDEDQRALMVEHGFEAATSFHRMRIDHDGARPEPLLPEGVEVRLGPGDEELRRTAHAIHQASFAAHYGFVPQEFEPWHEAFEASSTHDWTQLQVLLVDGEPAGLLVGNDQFVEDEGCGYVRIVGVLDQYRGRGLARLLLERAFARDAAAGRAGTLLHVDTANTTPALDLYLSVGMRAVLAIDMWHRDGRCARPARRTGHGVSVALVPRRVTPESRSGVGRVRRGAVGARARSCPTRAGRPACSSGRRPSGDRGPWRWPRRCSTAAARR